MSLLLELKEAFPELTIKEIEMKRTDSQRNSIELYCRKVSEQLNNDGIDMYEYIEILKQKGIKLRWTQELVKDKMWRVIQKSQVGKKSTTELTTAEVNQVYEPMARFLAERFHINVEFPSEETKGDINGNTH